MSMVIGFIRGSISNYNIIVVPFRILAHHTRHQSSHQLLVFILRMLSGAVFPHHIPDSGRFGQTEVLNVIICLFVSFFNLVVLRWSG